MSNNLAAHTFADKDGSFRRPAAKFRSTISPAPDAEYPAVPDRYVLYIHIGCPWAHRTNIVRSLKGLEDVIQMVVWDVSLVNEGLGWGMSEGKTEPLYGFSNIRQLYEKSEGGKYDGRCSVPMLWDKKTEKIVNNESSEIIRIFNTSFNNLLPTPTPDFYPLSLRASIDEMNAWTYPLINNGVYKAGFATSQSSYNTAVQDVFAALDRLEHHLSTHPGPYLFGENITEADIRVYPTLIRFDVAYHTIFKCNKKMVRHDYPLLHAWMRRLYWGKESRAFRQTVDFQAYKDGYTNAIGGTVVPIGPEVDVLPLE